MRQPDVCLVRAENLKTDSEPLIRPLSLFPSMRIIWNASWKCRFLGPNSDRRNQNHWDVAENQCFNKLPQWLFGHWHLWTLVQTLCYYENRYEYLDPGLKMVVISAWVALILGIKWTISNKFRTSTLSSHCPTWLPVYHLLAVWQWRNDLTSLNPSFLIWKMEIVYISWGIHWDSHEMLSTESGSVF